MLLNQVGVKSPNTTCDPRLHQRENDTRKNKMHPILSTSSSFIQFVLFKLEFKAF
jgi:hypothetical protein